MIVSLNMQESGYENLKQALRNNRAYYRFMESRRKVVIECVEHFWSDDGAEYKMGLFSTSGHPFELTVKKVDVKVLDVIK